VAALRSRDLLKLYIYGYLNQIRSIRRLGWRFPASPLPVVMGRGFRRDDYSERL